MDTSTILTFIFMSLISAYCIWRIMVTFLPSTKKSVRDYPARIVFRVFIFAHFIFSFLSHFRFIRNAANGYVSLYFLHGSFILGDFAALCLSKSIQDFAHFINRETSCFTLYFWNLSVPSYLILVCFQIGVIYSKSINSFSPVFVFSIVYSVVFIIVVCALIYFPLFTFLREIDRFDLNGERHKRVTIGYIFIIIACLGIPCPSFLYIWFQKHPINGHAVNFMREPIYLILAFTQDLIDWLIKCLVSDSESDIARTESLNLGLIV